MAGIEHLEVHSRSYIVRWVQVDEGHTLSWSVQPHKKSLNFGIVKHPGSGATTLVSTPGEDGSATSQTQGLTEGKSGRLPKRESTAQDLLASKGFIPIKWMGKFEADKVSIGALDVALGDAGMYGLVFDNTFSKQTSKTATFVVLTYPTGAPPQSTNHLPNLQLPNAHESQTSLGKYVPHLDGKASASSDSLQSHPTVTRPRSMSARSDAGGPNANASAHHHVGNLSKRRRKKGQGYARRFFSLDFSTCTLSYYYNRNSSALRGAIPLSLAAVAADERRREISIDSGAEIWHLRAPNDKEFQEWARALEKASRLARGMEAAPQPPNSSLRVDTRMLRPPQPTGQEEEYEWHQVETLVSHLVGTRDALRRLTKDVASGKVNPYGGLLLPGFSTVEEKAEGSGGASDKRPFWRRKSSTPGANSASQHSASPLGFPSPGRGNSPAASTNGSKRPKGAKDEGQEEKSLQDHCQALLSDLDSVVGEFTTLINSNKRRRMAAPLSPDGASRRSMETTGSTADEFFDALDALSSVVKINGSDDDEAESESDDGASFHDNSSVSSVDDEDAGGSGDARHLYPLRSKSLIPLPIDKHVQRRITIPPAMVMPPSLIAFVRKNVGKDLSTISMPVSANEPTSVLQKLAEQLEYAQLLNQAAKQKYPTERLLYVAAFAVSQFSSNRAKERAIRKPFTPLLGETYELVRTEHEVPGGFRLLVEKVQHRPLKLAMHAESAQWSFAQSPAPGNKFWGKSAEVTTDGRVRISLHLPDGTDELYSWNIATMFLRNVVMGEKYLEPVGTMHVLNDSTGHKASIEFRGKGMFGGRVEDVHVTTYSPDGSNTSSGLTGTWTNGLRTVGPGKSAASDEIWRVGNLVDNAANTYGLTEFAASLNEVTVLEKDKLPPTDCRLRPDQRMAEEGKLDEAEEWKQKLEEAQRSRRRAMEQRGVEHKPRWFVRAENTPEGEEEWKFKNGKDSYWEERARGEWTNIEDLFHV